VQLANWAEICCFGWVFDLWGDSPSTENPYYMGDLKISRKNNQQPTVNHFLIHGPETFSAWELQSYIVSSFKAVWNTSNTHNPWNPWDWYIYLHEWWIFYGKRMVQISQTTTWDVLETLEIMVDKLTKLNW